MIKPMGRVADAFWRAAAYCLHPRVIGLSLLPILVSGLMLVVLGYFFWEAAVAGVRATLESWSLVEGLLKWLDSMGAQSFRTVLAPIIVLGLALPAMMAIGLLLVAMMMTPYMADLVAQRRFLGLERKRGAGFWASLGWSVGHTLVALVLTVLTMPFWLIPPLFIVLPPLIWGWLNYRVFAFDVLGEHASRAERRQLLSEHRFPLMLLGLATGYLGAAPAAIFAFSAFAIALAPVLVVVFVFLLTLVFAFTSLWFAHYCLAALQEMRRTAPAPAAPPDPLMDSLPANFATAPPSTVEVLDAAPSAPATPLDKPRPLLP